MTSQPRGSSQESDTALAAHTQKRVQELRELLVNAGVLPRTTAAAPPAEPIRIPQASELARWIDHTLLKADATETDIRRVCEEAREHHFATVCVNGAHLPLTARLLESSTVRPIAVIGFPLGAASTESKAFEAREASRAGAQEIDMVISLGALKAGQYAVVLEDIRRVVEAADPAPVKVILETCLLTDDQKILGCLLAREAGAAFVKTSTGFSTGGATVEDVRLMRSVVGRELGVKASGGIRSWADARRMIEAGASRIGASASVAIVKEALAAESGAAPSPSAPSPNGSY